MVAVLDTAPPDSSPSPPAAESEESIERRLTEELQNQTQTFLHALQAKAFTLEMRQECARLIEQIDYTQRYRFIEAPRGHAQRRGCWWRWMHQTPRWTFHLHSIPDLDPERPVIGRCDLCHQPAPVYALITVHTGTYSRNFEMDQDCAHDLGEAYSWIKNCLIVRRALGQWDQMPQ